MKWLIALALVVVASAYQYAEEWEEWKKVSACNAGRIWEVSEIWRKTFSFICALLFSL